MTIYLKDNNLDDIRQKIADFEKTLQSPIDIFRSQIHKNPLLIAFIAIGSSILLCDLITDRYLLFIICGLLALLTLILAIFYRNNRDKTFLYRIAFIALVFVIIGSARFSISQYKPKNHITKLISQLPVSAELSGTIISPPKQRLYPDWQFSNFTFSDPGMTFRLKISCIKIDNIEKPASGNIAVLTYEPALNLAQGQRIKINCSIKKITPPYNPAQFNFKKYMKRVFNIDLSATVKKRADIKVLQQPKSNFLSSITTFIRQSADSLLTSEDNSQEDALLDALLLGNRQNISAKTNRAFAKTGLSHFISLSGLHLAFLIGFVWYALNIFRLHYKTKALLSILFILLFLLAVPPRAPILRASIIAVFFLFSIIIDKPTNPLNCLSLAGIILLLISPAEIFNIGFQLSFICVFGILVFAGRLKALANFGAASWISSRHFIIRSVIANVILMTAASLAAWSASSGIIAYNFYTVNPLCFLWTILISPLVSLILGLGFIKIVLAGAIPTVGVLISYILNFLCSSTISIVNFISENFSGSIAVGKLPIFAIAAYYILLICIVNADLLGKLKKITIGLISVIFIIAAGFGIYENHFFGGLKLSVLSVGAGQCIIAKTNKQTTVFDIGSMSVSDVGNKVVNPYLAYLGSSKLDALFISHPDLDHINGICEVLSRHKTIKLYSDEFSVFGKAHSSALVQLEDWLNDNDYQITANNNIPSDSKIQTIWHNSIVDTNDLKANDLSAVYLIEFGGRRILLCSDIEQAAQNKIMQLYPDLRADIVISPHHGSVNTSLADFIPSLAAETIITSCSTSQYQRIIKKKPNQHQNSLWTSQNGCIEVYIDKYSNVIAKPFIQN